MKKTDEATPQEIWNILKGVSEKQDQLVLSQQETDRQLKETDRQLKETDRQLKETDRQLKETDQRLRETRRTTDHQFKMTEKRLKKLDELFTDHWGKLMEALVKGDLIELLNERNISVDYLSQEHERKIDGKQYEFDIIALNGKEVVVVEVKTTLRLQDVNHFVEKLEVFKDVFKEYKDKTIYGAVAYLKASEGTEVRSQREGLFVIRATGSSSSIINTSNFRPKSF